MTVPIVRALLTIYYNMRANCLFRCYSAGSVRCEAPGKSEAEIIVERFRGGIRINLLFINLIDLFDKVVGQ